MYTVYRCITYSSLFILMLNFLGNWTSSISWAVSQERHLWGPVGACVARAPKWAFPCLKVVRDAQGAMGQLRAAAADGFPQIYTCKQGLADLEIQCLSVSFRLHYSENSTSSDKFSRGLENDGKCTLFQIAAVSGAVERARLVSLFEVGAFPSHDQSALGPLRPLASWFAVNLQRSDRYFWAHVLVTGTDTAPGMQIYVTPWRWQPLATSGNGWQQGWDSKTSIGSNWYWYGCQKYIKLLILLFLCLISSGSTPQSQERQMLQAFWWSFLSIFSINIMDVSQHCGILKRAVFPSNMNHYQFWMMIFRSLIFFFPFPFSFPIPFLFFFFRFRFGFLFLFLSFSLSFSSLSYSFLSFPLFFLFLFPFLAHVNPLVKVWSQRLEKR